MVSISFPAGSYRDRRHEAGCLLTHIQNAGQEFSALPHPPRAVEVIGWRSPTLMRFVTVFIPRGGSILEWQ
jgi:hypothetical protein